MRYILILIIITGLNLYSQMETAISVNKIKYSYIKNEEETKKVEQLYKSILKIENPKYKLSIIPLIVSELKSKEDTPPFYIITEKKENGNKVSLKIILFKNIIENFFKDNLLQILKKNIQEESNSLINISPKPFYLKILLHQISHFSGPSIIQDDSGKTVFIDEQLSNYFTVIEEIRADMSSLVITKKLVLEKFFTETDRKHIYRAHIAYLMYLSKNGSEKQRKISSIQLNFFKEKGGITHNMITDKVSIHMLDLETTANNILIKTTNFEKKATTSVEKIHEFIEKFSDIKSGTTKKEIKTILEE